MQPLISLIIPVYNVEKYLERCLRSVLGQTYGNYEVILVDDGSTDGSGAMCDACAAADGRVRAFHKPNGGLSDARNYGVRLARGELVSFIDSDDHVTADYLAYLYDLLERSGADVSCAALRKVLETDQPAPVEQDAGDYNEEFLSAADALRRMCYANIGPSACAKLYKKEILLKHPYPVGRLYEDLATTYKLFSECGTVAMSGKEIYYYFVRPGSITLRRFDDRQFDSLRFADAQFHFICQRFPAVKQAASYGCAVEAVSMLSRFDIFSDKENGKRIFKTVRDFLLPHLRDVLSDRRAPAYFKLSCLVVAWGYYPARVFFPLKRVVRRLVRGY